MAVARNEGGGGRSSAPKPKRNPVVVGPGGRPPASSSSVSRPPSSLSGGGTKSGGTKSGGKGSGKVSDPYAAAQAAATASANRSYKNAANRYNEQAKNLEAQAKALKHALNIDLKKGLKQQLGDISQILRQQQELVREGYRDRMKQLKGAARDNDKAQGQQQYINQNNQIRERESALSEAMSQGAGESDSLRAMLMSLRNWNANASEIERGYFDTLRSIKSSQTDLEVDTKSALANNVIQANSDKEQLYTNFYNQRSELYTQLGNTRGQQADYLAMAQEARANIEGKGGAKAKAEATAKAGEGKKAGPKGGNLGTKTPGAKAEQGKGGQQTAARRVMAGGPAAAPQSTFGRRIVQRDDDDEKKGRPNRTPGGRAEQGKGGGTQGGGGGRGGKGGGKKGGGGKGPLKGPGMGKVGGTAKNQAQAIRQSGRAFMQAAKATGRSWNNPGVPDKIMDWEGQPEIEAQANNLNRLDTVTGAQLEVKTPEGATLRRWA